MESDLIDINLECITCQNKQFKIINNLPTCTICKKVLLNNIKSNFNEKTKNKVIHLNNVIKNLETYNVKEIDDLVRIIDRDIKENNIDNLNFVDSTYICETLKKNGKKSYVLDIQVYNKYNNNNTRLSNNDKESIRIVFNEFFKFCIRDYSNICKNSFPYHQVLYNIYNCLDININIKPSNTRNKNEELNIIFNKFLNHLCEEFLTNKNHDMYKKDLYIDKPNIHFFPNIFYQTNKR